MPEPAPTDDVAALQPPDGWLPFGTLAALDYVPPVEFSEERDEVGDPLWERVRRPTPTDDVAALVARLRQDGLLAEEAFPMLRDAADALERLVADLAAARAEAERWRSAHTTDTAALVRMRGEAWAERDAARAEATEWAADYHRQRVRADRAEDRIRAAWGEIEHAYLNGHRLDSGCQGAFGDQRDAAVRVSSLAAALTRKAPGL